MEKREPSYTVGGNVNWHSQFKENWASQVLLVVKNSPDIAGNLTDAGSRSLGQEDPLEEEMETHSSILPWRIP